MLMVGVFGPKYPCEEVFIKHIGNNQYNVQYVSISLGEYFHWINSHLFLDCSREGWIYVDC
jgi:hypothetical protein